MSTNFLSGLAKTAVFTVVMMGCVGAQAAGSVSLQGPASLVAAGDTFTLDLTGQGFVPIVGGGADFSFDAVALELLSVAIDPAWGFLPGLGTIDNNAGTLTDLYFNVWGSMAGDFPIATLQFRAKAAGLSSVDVFGSPTFTFAAVDGSEVPVSFSGMAVQVSSPIPEPAAWLLMGSGLAMLGTFAARRRSVKVCQALVC